MLTLLHPDERNIPWETWLAADLPWVSVADLVIRLPGESEGADVECNHAAISGVKVVTWAEFERTSDV